MVLAKWLTVKDNIMLLLINCEVIGQDIRPQFLTYEPNEVRSIQKTKVQISSVWNEYFVNKSLLYSHHKHVGNFPKIFAKLTKYRLRPFYTRYNQQKDNST